MESLSSCCDGQESGGSGSPPSGRRQRPGRPCSSCGRSCSPAARPDATSAAPARTARLLRRLGRHGQRSTAAQADPSPSPSPRRRSSTASVGRSLRRSPARSWRSSRGASTTGCSSRARRPSSRTARLPRAQSADREPAAPKHTHCVSDHRRLEQPARAAGAHPGAGVRGLQQARWRLGHEAKFGQCWVLMMTPLVRHRMTCTLQAARALCGGGHSAVQAAADPRERRGGWFRSVAAPA